jgi:hypothetical protein
MFMRTHVISLLERAGSDPSKTGPRVFRAPGLRVVPRYQMRRGTGRGVEEIGMGELRAEAAGAPGVGK